MSMATPVDVGDDLQLAMQDAVKDRRRARKMLRDEVKNVIRRQKEGKDGVDFGEFDSSPNQSSQVAGQKISSEASERNDSSGGRQGNKPKKTDLTKEINSFFEISVGQPAKPFRERLWKVNQLGEEENSVWDGLSHIVNAGKDELHSIGDMICHKLIGLRSRLSSRNGAFHRLSGGLARVILHLNDCARYQEKPNRAVEFAQLLRILEPGYAEAHMRIGLSLPLIPDYPNGLNTLESFFHLCVFVANHGVLVDSKEAEVFRISAERAEKRLHELERQATPPEKLELFAARFISTCWSVVTGDIREVRELVVQSNFKMWNELRDILKGCCTDPKPKECCDRFEDALLYIVGIAIFVRHYISTKLSQNDALSEKRIAASDALLRNLSMFFCDSVCAGLQKFKARLIRRKKNRNRTRQRKRRNQSGEEASKLKAPPLDIHRRLIFVQEVIDSKIIPPSFGPVSILLSFWSTTLSNIAQQQLPMYVEAYKSLKNMLHELRKLAIHCGAEEFMKIARTKLDTAEQIPCLKEDVLFSSFNACKNNNLFEKVVLRKVEPNVIFSGDEDGMVDRAMTKLRGKTYESIVQSSCVHHLRAFSTQVANTARESCSEFTSSTAVSILLSTAIRQRRIELMIDVLSTSHMGRVAELAAPIMPGGTPQSEPKDVLETPPENEVFSRPLPGQVRPRHLRDTQDSADHVRQQRKRQKRNGPVVATTQVVSSQETPNGSNNAPSSSPPIPVS